MNDLEIIGPRLTYSCAQHIRHPSQSTDYREEDEKEEKEGQRGENNELEYIVGEFRFAAAQA